MLGISGEIEVATSAIDETTILEIKATIALPFKFDNVSRAMTAKTG